MSEYIVTKTQEDNEYQIVPTANITRTVKLPGQEMRVRVYDNGITCMVEGKLIGVFEKYSEAVRATIEQD